MELKILVVVAGGGYDNAGGNGGSGIVVVRYKIVKVHPQKQLVVLLVSRLEKLLHTLLTLEHLQSPAHHHC